MIRVHRGCEPDSAENKIPIFCTRSSLHLLLHMIPILAYILIYPLLNLCVIHLTSTPILCDSMVLYAWYPTLSKTNANLPCAFKWLDTSNQLPLICDNPTSEISDQSKVSFLSSCSLFDVARYRSLKYSTACSRLACSAVGLEELPWE